MGVPANQTYTQGQGSVGADSLNSFLQVSTFAAAAGFIGLPGMVIYITGFTTPGDGGQGHFFWSSSSLGPSDGVNVILPSGSLSGAWVRITSVTFYSYQAPVTGFSITIPNTATQLILNPAGTLATGLVTMPPAPYDGQRVGIASSQTITALSMSASPGQTLLGALTTIAPNTGFAWQWVAAASTWFRVQ
jgi:hypothetical protein